MTEKKLIPLDNARILATIAVVVLHCSSGVVVTGAEHINSAHWWAGNLYDSMFRWCVPFFVMITGAIFLSRKPEPRIGDFYLKRGMRIIVPIIFWSLFYLLIFFRKSLFSGNIYIMDIWHRLFLDGHSSHLWYLYMLVGLYVFIPFLTRLAQSLKLRDLRMFVLFCFIISIIDSFWKWKASLSYGFFLLWFVSYVPYLFAGYLFMQKVRILSSKYLLFIFMGAVVATALGCYLFTIIGTIKNGLYFYRYLSITVVPMSLSLYALVMRYDKLLFGRFQRILVQTSLGIYLIHPFIMVIVRKYLDPSMNNIHAVIGIPIYAIVVFLLSAAISKCIYQLPILKRII